MTESLQQRRARLAQEQLAAKEHRAAYVKVVRNIRTDISHSSFLSVQYKLEAIEANPALELKWDMSRAEIIRAYREAIQQHLDLQEKQKA